MTLVVVVVIGSFLLGLAGAGAGIYFILYGLGFFNYLGGKKSRHDAVNKDLLATKLLALNEASKPYHIVKGEDTDLVAEWKIIDASWYGVFSKSQLSKAYRARLLLDETRHSVRCFEELGSVNWTVGTAGITPQISYRKQFFGGRILFKKEYAVGYGIKKLPKLEVGNVYSYNFDIDEIRNPIIAIVRENGWEWVPVTAKRHATYK